MERPKKAAAAHDPEIGDCPDFQCTGRPPLHPFRTRPTTPPYTDPHTKTPKKGYNQPKKLGHEADVSTIDNIVWLIATVWSWLSGPSHSPAVNASWSCKIQLSHFCMVMGIVASTVILWSVGTMDKSETGRFVHTRPLLQSDTIPRIKWSLDKTMATGIVATHHRTGTVLFQNMLEKLCEQFLVDFERVEQPARLHDLNSTETLLYASYYNTTERLVVGMHGFDEHCPKGSEPAAYCGMLDSDCWLDACALKGWQKGSTVLPVVHVVRNPVEIVISSFLYHRQDPPPEAWLKNPKPDALVILPHSVQEKYRDVPYHQVLRQLDQHDALLVEFYSAMGDIYRAARNYRDLSSESRAFNLHYEKLREDFNGTTKQVLDHMQMTKKFELDRLMFWAQRFNTGKMSDAQRMANMHVTEGKFDKIKLRQEMYKDEKFKSAMEKISSVLGYHNPFSI